MENEERLFLVKKVQRDYVRFQKIIKGIIKKEFRKYMSKGELISKEGKYLISIPIKQVRIPTFRYKIFEEVGIGQGEGDIGKPISSQPHASGFGAGDQPGEHMLEAELTLEEIAQILQEVLQLPHLKPKGRDIILAPKFRYSDIARIGPESLRHFKRTYKQALKRQLASGTYDSQNPIITPIREDKRYKSWKIKDVPQNSAVIIFMMDVSGSMGDEQKDIVKTEIFWIDLWIRAHYKNIEVRYIAHDAVAREVSRDTFYRLREGGGTKISSAYELCKKLILQQFHPEQWNIYAFHFSDGDNWGTEDTQKCLNLLIKDILPYVNLFGYGQVKSAYGSGQFKKDVDEGISKVDNFISSQINSKDDIFDSIKAFFAPQKDG
jgi:hypothetical protein